MAKKLTSHKTRSGFLSMLFLNVVDNVIKKNRQARVTPNSERSMSMLIGPDSTSIAKIRRGERNPTLQQIAELGSRFNLDFNYFFRPLPIRYDLHNHKVFLRKKNEQLIVRMQEKFGEEVTRIQFVILTFREELQKLEKETGDSLTISESKKLLQEARKRINEAFLKI